MSSVFISDPKYVHKFKCCYRNLAAIFAEIASKIKQDNDAEIIELLKSSDTKIDPSDFVCFFELIFKIALESKEKLETVMRIIINLPERINFLQYTELYGSMVMKCLLKLSKIKPEEKVFIIKSLHQSNFYYETEVIEFFESFELEVERNLLKEWVSYLLYFVLGSKDFLLHKADYNTRQEVLRIAKRLFNCSLKRNVAVATRDVVRKVLNTLKVEIDENPRNGIDESFLEMIEMVKADKILTSKPAVNDVHREAAFFLDEAPKQLQPIGIYVKGIKKLKAIGCKKLAMEIILQCESRIRSNCKRKSGQDYSDEETLMMGYFYAEIGFQRLVPAERVKRMIELLEIKEIDEGFISGCSSMVKIEYTTSELFGIVTNGLEP